MGYRPRKRDGSPVHWCLRPQWPIELLERRTLLTAIPIVNPGFDTLFKPGSTSITATLPAGTLTTGFGGGVAVVDAGGAGAQANYSDGTTGTSVDVPG